MPRGAVVAQPYAAVGGGGACPVELSCAPVSASRLLAAIDVAFDGVPVPDEAHRTLYQADAADDYASCDRSRDHLGRWQDLPDAHLRECQWALAHLDAQGIRYYLPAIMSARLRGRIDPEGDVQSYLIDSLDFTLEPGPGYDLREYARGRLGGLDRAQRRVVGDYVDLCVSSDEARQAWARVREHDRLDGDGHWFEVWWPDRHRPHPAPVREAIVAAFDGVPAPAGAVPARWQDLSLVQISVVHLGGLDADAFRYHLPAHMLAVLGGAFGGDGGPVCDGIERALRPDLRPRRLGEVRERLAQLDFAQRRAVAGFLRRCGTQDVTRRAWNRAVAAGDVPGWFDELRGDEEPETD